MKSKKLVSSLTPAQQIQYYEDRRILRELNRLSRPDMHITIQPCSFGHVLIGVDYLAMANEHIIAVELGATPSECVKNFVNRWNKSTCVDNLFIRDGEPGAQNVDLVLQAIDQGIVDPSIQISLYGTHLQRDVWEVLRQVPFGTTITYKEVAERIQNKSAVRAVANAINHNPIAVIVPCHRVIRSDGTTSGYRWGDDIKHKLLERERV